MCCCGALRGGRRHCSREALLLPPALCCSLLSAVVSTTVQAVCCGLVAPRVASRTPGAGHTRRPRGCVSTASACWAVLRERVLVWCCLGREGLNGITLLCGNSPGALSCCPSRRLGPGLACTHTPRGTTRSRPARVREQPVARWVLCVVGASRGTIVRRAGRPPHTRAPHPAPHATREGSPEDR